MGEVSSTIGLKKMKTWIVNIIKCADCNYNVYTEFQIDIKNIFKTHIELPLALQKEIVNKKMLGKEIFSSWQRLICEIGRTTIINTTVINYRN